MCVCVCVGLCIYVRMHYVLVISYMYVCMHARMYVHTEKDR